MSLAVHALSIDLDDTLWPVWPAIANAEAVLQAWLGVHAPATAAAFDTAALRAVRDAVAQSHPEWRHDLSAVRRQSIAVAMSRAGDDPGLAKAAFDAFFAARQAVQPYADVQPALDRLAARWPLVALTNGNADVQRTPLGRYFRGTVSAREVGAGKPDGRMFHAACARLGVAADAVLHIGDDARLDIDGAHAAGLPAAWVRRADHAGLHSPQLAPRHTVADLRDLAGLLGV